MRSFYSTNYSNMPSTAADSWNNPMGVAAPWQLDASKALMGSCIGVSDSPTWSNWEIELENPAGSGKSWRFEWYVNDVATGIYVPFANGDTYSGSVGGSLSGIANGDLTRILAHPVGGPANPGSIRSVFDINAYAGLWSSSISSITHINSGATDYLNPQAGGRQGKYEEAKPVPFDMTLRRLAVRTNLDPAGSGSVTVVLHRNPFVSGAYTSFSNTTLQAAVNAGSTGPGLDLTNEVHLNQQDLVCWEVVNTGVQNQVFVGCECVPDISYANMFALLTESFGAPLDVQTLLGRMHACTMSRLVGLTSNTASSYTNIAAGQSVSQAIQTDATGSPIDTLLAWTLNGAGQIKTNLVDSVAFLNGEHAYLHTVKSAGVNSAYLSHLGIGLLCPQMYPAAFVKQLRDML